MNLNVNDTGNTEPANGPVVITTEQYREEHKDDPRWYVFKDSNGEVSISTSKPDGKFLMFLAEKNAIDAAPSFDKAIIMNAVRSGKRRRGRPKKRQ